MKECFLIGAYCHTEERLNNIFVPNICELYYTKLDEELMSCISDEEFEKYKSTNEEFIQEKLSDTIRREIQYSDTEDSLEYLKNRLIITSSFLSRFTLSISDFDNYFKVRRN